MHNIVDNLVSIKKEIQSNNSTAEVVAVSKTFPLNKILPLINFGHNHYGENKIQEAVDKWTDIKKDFTNIKLHFVGKLQTNKVKYALPLFDYIHSLDSIKLAEKIANEQIKKKLKPKIFIQINIGKEQQKNGIDIENLENFYLNCKKNYDLNIIGLMCLPPNDNNPSIHFSEMLKLLKNTDLKELSMGMTNDYINALKFNSTFLRIGSKIFGPRD
tara:strand:+ start:101 stop:745 length:645 start_codon:yes stop_codon:yes gene_type:complete